MVCHYIDMLCMFLYAFSIIRVITNILILKWYWLWLDSIFFTDFLTYLHMWYPGCFLSTACLVAYYCITSIFDCMSRVDFHLLFSNFGLYIYYKLESFDAYFDFLFIYSLVLIWHSEYRMILSFILIFNKMHIGRITWGKFLDHAKYMVQIWLLFTEPTISIQVRREYH